MQKNVWGSGFNVEDSIPALQWKLIPNENRIIAGFNCRKAVAKMFDSVYVFAFYTDEITISGGPCSINGLPGMILGITIPRLFTSWIATKVIVNGVNESMIKPVSVKKNYSMKSLRSTLDERTKDWYDEGGDPEEEKQQKNQFYLGNFYCSSSLQKVTTSLNKNHGVIICLLSGFMFHLNLHPCY